MMKSSLVCGLLFGFAVTSFAEVTAERPVSTAVYAPTAGSAQIASNGDGFFEVWSDLRDRGAVYASAVTRDGTALNPSGTFLTKGSPAFAVAWTGNSYLVVWSEGTDISGERFSADGKIVAPKRVIASNAFVSPDALSSNGNITVLAGGNSYYVLDPDANVIDSVHTAALHAYVTGNGEFLVTGGPSNHLDSSGRYVASTDRRWPYPIACRASGCITAYRNSPGPLVIAPYDVATLRPGSTLAELPNANPSFDLAVTDDGYVAVFGDGILQRLRPEGYPLGPTILVPGPKGAGVAAASNGRDVAVLLASGLIVNNSIIPVLDNFIVSASSITHYTVGYSANAQRDIHIARGASNYLAVWTENEGTYAGRLSFDGSPLDGRGTLLGSEMGTPSVIYSGASYLVVLRSEPFRASNPPSQTVIQIDPTTGAVTSRAGIPGSSVRIASNGSSLVGAWVDRDRKLMAAFLYPNGAVASAAVPIASPFFDYATIGNVSLAWNGTTWLVVWTDDFYSVSPENPLPIPRAVRFVQLSAALIPLDTQPIVLTPSSEFNVIDSLRVASDGRDFLVAWSSFASIHERRVLASGVPDAERGLFNGLVADLVWDGAAYDLAFYTGRPYYNSVGDLAAARLRSSGEPIETLVISATAEDDRSASLVPIGNGRVLAAYTRVAFETPYEGVERAFVSTPRPVRGRATSKRPQ
jgi:hypothetical protein